MPVLQRTSRSGHEGQTGCIDRLSGCACSFWDSGSLWGRALELESSAVRVSGQYDTAGAMARQQETLAARSWLRKKKRTSRRAGPLGIGNLYIPLWEILPRYSCAPLPGQLIFTHTFAPTSVCGRFAPSLLAGEGDHRLFLRPVLSPANCEKCG
jgi:hypothetical protein